MEELKVTVDTPDVETEEQFIREYVVPAVKRLGETYEIIFYGRYFASTDIEGGQIRIVFKGDPDEILTEERERWGSFDYVDGWDTEIESGEGKSKKTAEERALVEQCGRVAARMNVHYFEEFDDRPPIGRVTEDRFHTRGIWVLIHFLLNEQGYSPEEEVDALFLALRDRLARIEAEHDLERVEEVVTELHDRLDDTQDKIDREFSDE